MEGELDLQRFSSVDLVREDVKPWQSMIVQLQTREMPPKDQPQPSDAQRKQLIEWVQRLLDSEARARAGDPGHVPLHRLSNTQYDNTIRDLTGVDLRPTRDFPADGAAGEGFTNAAQALSMSPALMAKYAAAAKTISNHAVLLPDGFRFSKTATRRDWTDESLAELRPFYRQFTNEGSLPLKPYVNALIENRENLKAGRTTLSDVAQSKNLSPKYLRVLWDALRAAEPSFPMSRVQSLWQNAKPGDADAIMAEVSSWFDRLWEFPKIGSYVSEVRQKPKDPAIKKSKTITVKLEPAPGQTEVNLHLVARNLVRPRGKAVFANPRFTADNRPTLKLRDYKSFGPTHEVDLASVFANSEKYLAAAVELANQNSLGADQIAAKHRIEPTWFKNWIEFLDLNSIDQNAAPQRIGRTVSTTKLTLLDELAPNPQYKAVNGWRPKGTDLPIVIANSSEKAENVPGRITGHGVAVHPMPSEFVAVVWKSPIEGRVRVNGKVAHAHPACGNGVAWFVEYRTNSRSAIISEGAVDLGKETTFDDLLINVTMGDRVLLAVDARDVNHVCDLTEIAFKITELKDSGPRVWDLATDISDDIEKKNPHSDGQGNADIWSFVRGQSKDRPLGAAGVTHDNSLLARWRRAASTADGQSDTTEYAKQLQTLLTGTRPAESDVAKRKLYDQLVSYNGPLLNNIDIATLSQSKSFGVFGLPVERFEDDDLVVGEDTTVRLPAALFREYQFQVDCQLLPLPPGESGSQARRGPSAVQFQVLTEEPASTVTWNAAAPIIATDEGRKRLLEGLAEFRRVFPPNVCYPHIIPLDEVVCLKTFHREDQPLIDLFLTDEQTAELERLWAEHRFVTKFPIVENEYLPLFIGFVTQDQPKELVKFFEDKRPSFQQWSDDFSSDYEKAAPSQLKQLMELASRAYRRPLLEGEANGIESLYQSLRDKGVAHEEAFRSLIARVLMSPSFLLHLERAPNGKTAAPVNDWELASRLSYFLWSSMPDDNLRQLAATGRLHDPNVLAEQATRMLKDDRVRSLAIEFGTQMIHVRGFDTYSDKNEKLFPEFDAALRSAINEESILFFQDLFQNDRSVASVITADYTYLNEKLASHYGIPDVQGEQFRRFEGAKKFGRGGVLGLASVHTKQAGASRTSPVLRGNWLVETLLGERLPRPPPNVPELPESELDNGGLTMREIVAKHVSDPQCASCHQRIDPFGLALENYDPIGRLRVKDLGGLPIDASAKLRDGTQFTGIDGLRDYLISNKQEQFVRVFYKRLVGYALGRATSLSDQVLIDQMMEVTNNGRTGVTKAIIAIVNSPQFRNIRGAE